MNYNPWFIQLIGITFHTFYYVFTGIHLFKYSHRYIELGYSEITPYIEAIVFP